MNDRIKITKKEFEEIQQIMIKDSSIEEILELMLKYVHKEKSSLEKQRYDWWRNIAKRLNFDFKLYTYQVDCINCEIIRSDKNNENNLS